MSGIGLAHGTPILDVRPLGLKNSPSAYVTLAHHEEESKRENSRVFFTELAHEELDEFAMSKGFDFYYGREEVKELIVRVLERVPNLTESKMGKGISENSEGGELDVVSLDNLNIIYAAGAEEVTVVKVLYATTFSSGEHSKEWFKKIVEVLGLRRKPWTGKMKSAFEEQEECEEMRDAERESEEVQ